MSFLDPASPLLDRDPWTLSNAEVKILQDELRRYRSFWAASTEYSTTFVIDEFAERHGDGYIEFRKGRAGLDLGRQIVEDRNRTWLHLPDDRRSKYELRIHVWPENFFNPKGHEA